MGKAKFFLDFPLIVSKTNAVVGKRGVLPATLYEFRSVKISRAGKGGYEVKTGRNFRANSAPESRSLQRADCVDVTIIARELLNLTELNIHISRCTIHTICKFDREKCRNCRLPKPSHFQPTS